MIESRDRLNLKWEVEVDVTTAPGSWVPRGAGLVLGGVVDEFHWRRGTQAST